MATTDDASTARGPAAAAKENADRLAAAREMGRANRAIEAMQAFFGSLAVVAGTFAYVSEGVRRWTFAGGAVVMVAGAIGVRWRPVAWSVVLACVLVILEIVPVYFTTEVDVAGLFFAAVACMCIPWMQRTHALASKYPDSPAARRLTGAPRPPRGGRSTTR